MPQESLVASHPPRIEIVLATDKSISVDDISKLLRALGYDYKAITDGRTLVVTSIQSGSVIILLTDAYVAMQPYLEDALETLKAWTSLAEFVNTLKEATNRFRHRGKPAAKERLPGDRTAIEIFKIASSTGRPVDFRHRNADGELTEIHIGPEEVLGAQSIRTKPDEPVEWTETAYVSLRDLKSKSPTQIAEAILTIASLDNFGISDMVRKVIEAIRIGIGESGTALKEVGSELRAAGRADLADLLGPPSAIGLPRLLP